MGAIGDDGSELILPSLRAGVYVGLPRRPAAMGRWEGGMTGWDGRASTAPDAERQHRGFACPLGPKLARARHSRLLTASIRSRPGPTRPSSGGMVRQETPSTSQGSEGIARAARFDRAPPPASGAINTDRAFFAISHLLRLPMANLNDPGHTRVRFNVGGTQSQRGSLCRPVGQRRAQTRSGRSARGDQRACGLIGSAAARNCLHRVRCPDVR
jgi:hypothetical protein